MEMSAFPYRFTMHSVELRTFPGCLCESRCSFRRGERNRKPPGGKINEIFPPDPRAQAYWLVSGCIWDVSGWGGLPELKTWGGNPPHSRRMPSMEALVQPLEALDAKVC